MGDGDNSPASIIHSVDEQPASTTGSPVKRPNAKARQSSNAVQNIRRIFSPTYDRKSNATPPQQQSDDDTTANNNDVGASNANAAPPASPNNQAQASQPGPRRKNVFSFIRACFVPTPDDPPQLDPMNIIREIRESQPTYEPEHPLLPPPDQAVFGRACLVLDLDETLVHSSFTPIPDPDFEIPLEMQGDTHMVYVKKRPGVDDFLAKVCQWYEVIVFTASLALYANPVMDLLDPQRFVHGRLYREHCVFINGCYVKDISKLGRDLNKTIIVDNSPLSYALQPENAIPITSFITDDNDRELEKTLALLQEAKNLPDVRNMFS